MTPDSVSRCRSRKVLVMATVLVSEVSKTTLKSPSAEITLGFRKSKMVAKDASNSFVDDCSSGPSAGCEGDAEDDDDIAGAKLVATAGALPEVEVAGAKDCGSWGITSEDGVGRWSSVTGETSGDTAELMGPRPEGEGMRAE